MEVTAVRLWKLKRTVLLTFFSLSIFILGCKPSSRSSDMNKMEARAIMDSVSRKNLAYEPLTEHDDTLMQRVVAYYKEHGTSNELMEAYYLLGSVCRDLHEAPRAMEAFLNGINAADTTDTDCRYDLLTRLYGQKCDILHKQKLYKESAEAGRMVYKYAVLAKDTLFMVASQWGRFGEHFAFADYQTIADECWDVLEESKRLGMYDYGVQWLCTSVLANMELGRVKDAQKLLSIYEQHSGCVDLKTHECSFPIYYYAKGRVLAAVGQLDSAGYYYQKELEQASDWNNRQAAYRGLRLVFEQTGQMDSLCKYAPLQCDAVDSAYQEKLSQNLQNLHEMYDYTRLQTENNQQKLQLQENRRKALYIWGILAFVIVCSLFTFLYLRSLYRQRIAHAELKLERADAELEERENSLAILRDELARVEDEKEKLSLARQVEQAEREAEKQRKIVIREQEALDKLRRQTKINSRTLRGQYYTTPLFQSLLQKIKDNKAATEQDYEQIQQALLERDAELLQRFCMLLSAPSETELHVFLLLRFGMTKKEASLLISCSKSAVTNSCNRLYHKVKNEIPATSAEANEWLLRI